jgi:predicted 3-demethylubiquinone-9 3-methyltransferase (glyoxalase superfamily)
VVVATECSSADLVQVDNWELGERMNSAMAQLPANFHFAEAVGVAVEEDTGCSFDQVWDKMVETIESTVAAGRGSARNDRPFVLAWDILGCLMKLS